MSGADRDPLERLDAADLVRGSLAKASHRIRRLRAFSRGARFALAAHVVLIPWILFRNLVALPFGLYIVALLILTLSGGAYGLLSPLPLSLVARLLDHRLALKERLGSALEVMHRQGHPMVDALLDDAAAAAEGGRAAVAFPMVIPAEARYLLPAVALTSALFLLPPLTLRIPGPGSFLRGPARGEEQQPPAAEAARPDNRSWGSPNERREPEAREASRGSAPRQAWNDLTATFKDTAIASKRPDFASFLKRGDERLKLLAPSAAFPDLQDDYTQRPGQAQIRRMQEALREARLGRRSPAEMERLMGEMKSLDRRPEGQGALDGKERQHDFTGEQGPPSDRRLEALERALGRLRERGASRGEEAGRRLKPAPDAGSWEGDRERGEDAQPDGSREEGRENGSRPGRTPSSQVAGRPTPRIESPKLESALSGRGGEGKQESYDTGLSGAGAENRSRLPYLDLLTHYRQVAEEALSKERVPFNYREQVKAYFKSLER